MHSSAQFGELAKLGAWLHHRERRKHAACAALQVRHAVRNSKVVRHDERVLVAYSGGALLVTPCSVGSIRRAPPPGGVMPGALPCTVHSRPVPGLAGCSSRALVHYLEVLHTPRTARIVRSRLNFDLTVLYVDEGASWGLTQAQSAAAVAAARASVAAYSATVPFLSAALEDVYAPAASAAVAEVADPAPSANQAGGFSGAGLQPERVHSGDANGSGAAPCSAPLSTQGSTCREERASQRQLPGDSGDSQSVTDAAERRQRLQRLLEVSFRSCRRLRWQTKPWLKGLEGSTRATYAFSIQITELDAVICIGVSVQLAARRGCTRDASAGGEG